MKICIAQTKSEKGNIQANINNHLKLISQAVELEADLIIFPELSITNYEPELANELATDLEDKRFAPFQALSDQHQISIGLGMPIRSAVGITISMLLFQANKERGIYSKSLLHSDELPYFVCGHNTQPYLKTKGKKIALGICYETLQRAHFIQAQEANADLYIASVAKPDRGTDKAYEYFPSIAKEFNTPILLCNAVGYSDNFMSNGLSAVWNNKGELIGQLDAIHQGILVYDTEN